MIDESGVPLWWAQLIHVAMLSRRGSLNPNSEIHKTPIFMEEMRKQDAIRVQVNEDGTIDLFDFTLPSESGMERRGVRQEDVPTWVMESISMLRITDPHDYVPEIGFKINDTLYYIRNRAGDSNHEDTQTN